jgi:hypothetical protein
MSGKIVLRHAAWRIPFEGVKKRSEFWQIKHTGLIED